VKIKIKDSVGNIETSYSPRSKMDQSVAVSNAIKKAFGKSGRFMQNSGLPKGYGAFVLDPNPRNISNVLGIGTLEILS
jgi:hypothetical protein